MFIIEKVNDWDVVVSTWKSESQEKAERFVNYMNNTEGIYPEFTYHFYEVDNLEEVPDVSDEHLNESFEYYNNEVKRIHEAIDKFDDVVSQKGENMTDLTNTFGKCELLTDTQIMNWINE